MMGALSDLLARANPANDANPKERQPNDSPNSHDSQTVIAKIRRQLHDVRGTVPAALVDSIDAEDVRACNGVAPETLGAYLRALARRQRMAAGEVPAGSTRAVACAGCGPVLLWADAPDAVIGCPWCHHRKAGRIIPRPATAESQSKQSKARTGLQDAMK